MVSTSRLAAFVALVALAIGCASAIPRPTSADAVWASARWPDASLSSLEEGRDLYVAKCSGCHSLYSPSQVVGPAFPANLDEMAGRAHLARAQRDLIAQYLETAAREQASAQAAR